MRKDEDVVEKKQAYPSEILALPAFELRTSLETTGPLGKISPNIPTFGMKCRDLPLFFFFFTRRLECVMLDDEMGI